MEKKDYDVSGVDVAWCPGCGDFGILTIVKQALAELGIPPDKLVLCSGIGQAAKLPQYIKCHYFNGLHGRSLPPATAIKAVNPEMTVIAVSGDGCTYGEGGNHFIHTIRRNPDITNIVHDNMIYGLTKGQASPTSQKGLKTPVQTHGVFLEPFNPLAVAIALDASFVARVFVGDAKQSVEIIKKAITHKGYALVDVLQPCVSFNKVNSYQWFKDNTYYLDDKHDPHDKNAAFSRATEHGKLALGIFYMNEKKPVFEESFSVHAQKKEALWKKERDLPKMLSELMLKKRN